MSDFGDRVALLREKSGETLDQVAEATAMTKSYIWEIENKPSIRPSAVTARKLSKHFGVTMEYLMGFKALDNAVDKAFFERYQNAPPKVRSQLRDILSVLLLPANAN